jgi:hypothetical protein
VPKKQGCATLPRGVSLAAALLEGPPLGDWLAGRLKAHGVPLAGRVHVRLRLEVLGQAAG